MKKLDKRLRYTLNALWLAAGICIGSLISALRHGENWIKSALLLLTVSVMIYSWENISTLIRDKLIPAEEERFGK
ncbi:hypothetical protein ACVRZR_02905 [Streptococcus entericus]|uniref:hypothetical protein n=1 Tax=Streptococcus entericus TaxID=155680 RepID=UPI0011EA630C|nr:hypothetical protein [Streptococcus entericus]